MESNDVSPPISVCVPARNEGRTIAATLESILNQRFDPQSPPEMEVLVCANACTDNTVAEVRRIQRQHSGRIRLIEIAEKGKPNAWNVLRRLARHECVIFVDGDVVVDAKAFYFIRRMLLQHADLILVAGQTVGLLRYCSLLTRLSLPPGENGVLPYTWQQSICGRMLAFKKSEMQAAIRVAGFDDMPANTINNDRWMRYVLDTAASRQKNIALERVLDGEGRNWAICRDALVYFVPHDWWSDRPKVRARTIHGHEQLKRLFPACYAPRRKGKRSGMRRGVLRRASGAFRQVQREGAGYVLRGVMMRILEKRARRIVAGNKSLSVSVSADAWVRGETSKALTNIDAVYREETASAADRG